jgi:hypothetical protein
VDCIEATSISLLQFSVSSDQSVDGGTAVMDGSRIFRSVPSVPATRFGSLLQIPSSSLGKQGHPGFGPGGV